MKDGRIEQIGTPDEIYNHPKTSYVATFVGNANILHGAAESIQGQNAIVKIGNDKVIVKLETSQQNTEDTGVKQYLSLIHILPSYVPLYAVILMEFSLNVAGLIVSFPRVAFIV